MAHCREGLAGPPADAGDEALTQLRAGLLLALHERYTRTGHLASLREAVTEAERIAEQIPEFAAELPTIPGNLTTLLVQYARQTGDTAELDRSRLLTRLAEPRPAPQRGSALTERPRRGL
ncbi:hypothetical protein [Streptomyces sp. NPDC051636]|uniref:hypothetical protein n=1 Tax=Streptomyces sp. NPDC051636 TaxID=3365663 RepID=UPI0037BA5347